MIENVEVNNLYSIDSKERNFEDELNDVDKINKSNISKNYYILFVNQFVNLLKIILL